MWKKFKKNFNIIQPTQAKNEKFKFSETDIVLIFYYWTLIFVHIFQQAFFKTSILEPSEALHIVRIANITKPLWILYQISKLFLNFGYLGNIICHDPFASSVPGERFSSNSQLHLNNFGPSMECSFNAHLKVFLEENASNLSAH